MRPNYTSMMFIYVCMFVISHRATLRILYYFTGPLAPLLDSIPTVATTSSFSPLTTQLGRNSISRDWSRTRE